MDPMAAVSKVAATREVLFIGSPRWGAVAGPGWGRWSGGEQDLDGLCQMCLCRGLSRLAPMIATPLATSGGMSRRSCVGRCGSDCSGRQQMFGVGTTDDVGEGGLLDGLVLEREPTVVLALVLLPTGDLELLDEGSRVFTDPVDLPSGGAGTEPGS